MQPFSPTSSWSSSSPPAAAAATLVPGSYVSGSGFLNNGLHARLGCKADSDVKDVHLRTLTTQSKTSGDTQINEGGVVEL